MSQPVLYHLVYQSLATHELSEQELQLLLRQSRAWNAAHELTGMLLYSHGQILQVLEGPADEVLYIFKRISQDCRHHNIIRLADGPVEQRNFSDWSMGFQAIDPAEYAQLAGYRNPLADAYLAPQPTDGPGSLHALLSTFVRREALYL
ncbi:BLUF domain-containing protein [Hymenobacter latericus]|uniref:BLUF domain-containing protein n=1 Tax=Hymenobacter sp. YIM 151858-1 TaxID=2987688 RepID=UPI0022279C39|nr:BLUF domain-containing protein [Hymenobacter sp. YIM 151858-1]UYZ60625.1 BLUF domain-containing protein [Hymenobacter sp. YIM 151858-1]